MLLFAFAAVLLLAVLLSSLAHRTILSTAVLFLVAGFVLGPDTTGVLEITADSEIVATLAELALFTVLFTTACGSVSPTCARRGDCPAGRSAGACR